jgi:hypothetical protein
MHPYGDHLERYLNRELPASVLAAIDLHVSNCLYCSLTLGGTAAATTGWERRGLLGRLVRVPQQEPAFVTAENELTARAA